MARYRINAERLRDTLERRGMLNKTGREWLAAECGITPKTMGEIIRGEKNPSQGVILYLARALGVECETFCKSAA